MKLMNKIFFVFLLPSFLLLNCDAVKYSNISKEDAKYDSISIKYFNEELYNSNESNGWAYLGSGRVINIRPGPGAQAFKVIFDKILFSYSDSTLIIKGKLIDVFNNNSIYNLQIVLVRLNDDIKYWDDPKYLEYGNYLINEEGKFETEFKIINGETKIIFCEQPSHDEKGNSVSMINSMSVYDVFKLLK
jgi:hypothetical protein